MIKQSRYRNATTAVILAGLLALPVASNADTESASKTSGENSLCSQAAYAMALRYQQQSAEAAALQRQSFALATYRLRDKLKDADDNADLAIMTDLDETVLDNSALLARDMAACHDYTKWDTWKHWERKGDPTLIPGAKDFLDFADEHDIAIYYVSDRYEENKDATMATLKALDLPQASMSHVLLLGPSKAKRRAQVRENHTLIMQLGDSLPDFAKSFDDATLEEQHEGVEANAEHFGDDWIVLPNATYGSWSDAKLHAWGAPMKVE